MAEETTKNRYIAHRCTPTQELNHAGPQRLILAIINLHIVSLRIDHFDVVVAIEDVIRFHLLREQIGNAVVVRLQMEWQTIEIH